MGCAIAEEFSEHPEYRIYKIDSTIEERGSLSLGEFADMQEYEEELDISAVEVYLRSIRDTDEVLLIMTGGEPISGTVLKILGSIQDCKISLLYVCPERSMISQLEKRDDKIAFNVVQEYARSGVINNVFLIDKGSIEAMMGDVSITDYERSLCHLISYTVAMINYFQHTKPILKNGATPMPWARIGAFGISSLDEAHQLQMMFPLKNIDDLHFYYGFPREELDSDPTLMKQIKQHTRFYQDTSKSTSFSVYSTTFDKPMVLAVAYSSVIQPFVSGGVVSS
jgi:hypothetical protein